MSQLARRLQLPLNTPSGPAPLNRAADAVRTHVTTLNLSVEALSSRLSSTTAELGDAKREVQALVVTQGKALESVQDDVRSLVNRSQRAILDALGTPAQSLCIQELASSLRIFDARLDALSSEVGAVSARLGTLEAKMDVTSRNFAAALEIFTTKHSELTATLKPLLYASRNLKSPPPQDVNEVNLKKRLASDILSSSDDEPLAIGLAKRQRTSEPTLRSSPAAIPTRSSTSIPHMPGTFCRTPSTRKQGANPSPASDASLYVSRAPSAQTAARQPVFTQNPPTRPGQPRQVTKSPVVSARPSDFAMLPSEACSDESRSVSRHLGLYMSDMTISSQTTPTLRSHPRVRPVALLPPAQLSTFSPSKTPSNLRSSVRQTQRVANLPLPAQIPVLPAPETSVAVNSGWDENAWRDVLDED